MREFNINEGIWHGLCKNVVIFIEIRGLWHADFPRCCLTLILSRNRWNLLLGNYFTCFYCQTYYILFCAWLTEVLSAVKWTREEGGEVFWKKEKCSQITWRREGWFVYCFVVFALANCNLKWNYIKFLISLIFLLFYISILDFCLISYINWLFYINIYYMVLPWYSVCRAY